eukprot:332421-Chlamydomonas_euryale.AAC.1
MIVDTNAYSARSDRIAKMLEVYTMKGSSVTPKTAGMESTANSTSDSSTMTSASSSGVARCVPSAMREKKLSPSYVPVVLMYRSHSCDTRVRDKGCAHVL